MIDFLLVGMKIAVCIAAVGAVWILCPGKTVCTVCGTLVEYSEVESHCSKKVA